MMGLLNISMINEEIVWLNLNDLRKICEMAKSKTIPKVAFTNNKVTTEETNVILLSQWYPKYINLKW